MSASPSTALRRPRVLLGASLGLLAVFVLFGVGVFVDPTSPWAQPMDDAWRRFIGVGPDSSAPTGFLPMLFQHLGQLPGTVLMMLLLPGVLALIGRWRSALFVIAVQLVGPGLLSQLTKNLVDRPRPSADGAAGLFGPVFTVDHGSFPSGHSVSMGVIVITVFALIPPSARVARKIWVLLSVLLAAGMIWQRTLINAHWLSDTFAGLVAGVAAAALMWWLFWPLLQRDYGRRVWFLAAAKAQRRGVSVS